MSEATIKKTAKNIYDRLYRANISAKMDEIKVEVIKVSPTGELTKDEKDVIFQSFVNSANAYQKTVDVETSDNVTGGEEVKEGFSLDSKLNALATTSQENSTPVTEPGTLTRQQVNTLVSTTILDTNLDIAVSDMRMISASIFERNLSEKEAVEYLAQVIKSLVANQENEFNSLLKNSISDVVSTVNASYQRRNDNLHGTLNSLKTDLEESNSQYKSCITAFKAVVRESLQG